MKKVIFCTLLIILFIRGYSQNSYNLVVQANNIRVYSKPLKSAYISNTTLNFGEKIRLIDAVVEDRQQGTLPERFCRLYRNGDNNKPYYMHLAEANVDLKNLQITPSYQAIIEKKVIENVWVPINNIYHKKGEIIFYNGKNNSGIYSFLNEASLVKSDLVSNEFVGFYRITNIFKCKVEGNDKVFFNCSPLKTAFNEQKENNIYIDYFIGGDNINFQKYAHGNGFFSLLLDYAYNPNQLYTLNGFYEKYLSFLYGEEVFSNMDNFKKQRLFNSSKPFIDSVYNERTKTLNVPLSNVFFSSISDYNFQNNTFKILDISNTRNELNQLINKFYLGRQLTGGFINLPLFNSNLSMNLEDAENFTKEIKTYEINPYNSNGKEVVLIAHFKYITFDRAKILYKSFDTDVKDFNFQKVIDSIEIYSGKGFTRKDFIDNKSSPVFDKSRTKKWGTIFPNKIDEVFTKEQNKTGDNLETKIKKGASKLTAILNGDFPSKDDKVKNSPTQDEEEKAFKRVDVQAQYPGGETAFKTFLKRRLSTVNEEPGIYKVVVFVDKHGSVIEVVSLNKKDSNFSKSLVTLIKNGPKWTPAILNDNVVKSYKEIEISLPFD